MERQNLTEPFDLHLQWFGDPAVVPPAAPPATPAAMPPAGPAPTPPATPPVTPPVTPPTPPEPELKADGTFLAQAPDKYKKDQKFLKDLLGGEKPSKSWGDVLDRMYAAEARSTELQTKLAPAPTKLEEYEFDALKFPDHLAGDENKGLRENLEAYIKAQDDTVRAVALKAGMGKETAKLVNGIIRETIFAQQKAAQDDYAKQRETGLTALKENWKGDFAAHEDVARRAILTFGKEELVQRLALLHLENEPALIQTFYNIGKAIGEGQLVPGKPGPAVPTEEQKKAAALKQRYPLSPELTGAPPAAAAVDQAALDRLAKRFPQQAKELKK